MKQKVQLSTSMGVALISAAILTLEIVLTRVFSVMMWYHFAFMAISLALLGSGIAGVWLYLLRGRFSAENLPTSDQTTFINRHLTRFACLFSLTVVLSFLTYLRIPFSLSTVGDQALGWSGIGWLTVIYLVLAIPFLFGGATIALALSHYNQSVGRLYFFDLIGASIGCVLSIVALTLFGGGGSVLFVALLGALAAFAFSGLLGGAWRLAGGAVALVAIMLLVSNTISPWLLIRTQTGYDADNELLYERWNALSRVTVYEDPYWLQPFGWGLSPTFEGPDPGHLLLLIDAKAGTPIQKWTHNIEDLDYLKYDLTSLAYYLLPNADTFIIGPGGGRDIWTGRIFDAKTITGVELNPAIIGAVRGEFAEYAGWVYEHPNVTIAVEDARTFLMRNEKKYDLIQASLIDTWAASSAKVFALSENGLYTQDAFLTYFDRLTERGIVSYSRWYFLADPTETLRLVSLGLASWEAAGVENVGEHMVVIGNLSANRSASEGLATMLLKKTPFTDQEIALLKEKSAELDFAMLYAPGIPADQLDVPNNPVHQLITAPDWRSVVADYPFDISPPTDNRPFFFNFVRQGDLLSPELQDTPLFRTSAEGNYVLLAVLGIATVIALIFLLGPLAVRGRGALTAPGSGRYLFYFAMLGMGFLLIEIPMIQRLTLYLGSPTYALAVVLAVILLSSGLGSLYSGRISAEKLPTYLRNILLAVLAIAIALSLLIPPITSTTQALRLPLRILIVTLMLFPLGFVLGQPFPLGIRQVGQDRPALIPWLWAVNGATSVVGSALATITALSFGFQIVSLLGVAAYIGAFLVMTRGQVEADIAHRPAVETAG